MPERKKKGDDKVGKKRPSTGDIKKKTYKVQKPAVKTPPSQLKGLSDIAEGDPIKWHKIQMNKAEARMNKAEARMNKAEAELAEFKKALANYEAKFHGEKEAAEKRSRYLQDDLKQKLATIQEERDELQQLVDVQDRTNAELKQKFDQEKARSNNLKQELDNELTAHNEMIAHLDNTTTQLADELAASKALNEELKSQLSSSRDSEATTPSSHSDLELEQRTENVRKTYIRVKRRSDNIFAIGRDIRSATASMDLSNFGEFGQYIKMLRMALEEEDDQPSPPEIGNEPPAASGVGDGDGMECAD